MKKLIGTSVDYKTHVTAGELRSMSMSIPENIPDCGWVKRISIEFEPSEIEVEVDGTVKPTFKVKFHEPFHWVTISCNINDKGG